jgi:hypothetical protein
MAFFVPILSNCVFAVGVLETLAREIFRSGRQVGGPDDTNRQVKGPAPIIATNGEIPCFADIP